MYHISDSVIKNCGIHLACLFSLSPPVSPSGSPSFSLPYSPTSLSLACSLWWSNCYLFYELPCRKPTGKELRMLSSQQPVTDLQINGPGVTESYQQPSAWVQKGIFPFGSWYDFCLSWHHQHQSLVRDTEDTAELCPYSWPIKTIR
jgi:hypothetical protein